MPPALDLGLFELCQRRAVKGVQDNLSGGTIDPRNGTLVMVVNKPPTLVRYDPEGPGPGRTERVANIAASTTDSEGIAWLGPNAARGNKHELCVVQEADLDDPVPGNRIVVFDADTFRPTGEQYFIDIVYEHNKGLEGVAYDPVKRVFYAVQEKGTRRVIAVQRAKEGTTDTVKANYTTVLNFEDLPPATGVYGELHDMSDIAGLSWLDDGNWLVLSQELEKVAVVDAAAPHAVQSNLGVGGTQPEGVVWDADRQVLFVIGEPNELAIFATDCAGRGFPVPPSPPPSPPRPPAAPPAPPTPIRLNEVSDKGTPAAGTCGDEDWIELYNSACVEAPLSGLLLTDDHGETNPKARRFDETDGTIAGHGFRVICKGGDGFDFGIGGKDTVYLYEERTPEHLVEVDSVSLTDGSASGSAYARKTDGNGSLWEYVSDPTPGASNSGGALPCAPLSSARGDEGGSLLLPFAALLLVFAAYVLATRSSRAPAPAGFQRLDSSAAADVHAAVEAL